MNLTIRPFGNTPDEHKAIADLTNSCYTNHVYTAEQVAASHASAETDRDTDGGYTCHIAYLEDRPVGFAEGGADWLEVTVHPDYQGRGVGSRLYDRVYAHVAQHNPKKIGVQIREDWTRQEAFYAKRGFSVESRWGQWKLELEGFEPGRFPDPPGVEFKTLAGLEQTPELLTSIHDLYALSRRELRWGRVEVWTLEQFCGYVLESFWFRPECFWLAFDDSRLVGLHWVAAYPDDPTLFLEWICVEPRHRRRGIAAALKRHSLEFGKASGYAVAEANHGLSDVENINLNAKLGFVGHPGYLNMVKTLEASA